MTDAPAATSQIVTLSLVVPAYNEGQNLKAMIRKIQSDCRHCTYEIVLVNDGSTDETGSIATELANEFSTVTVIHLSRTFGRDNATLAGLKFTTGEYVSIMDPRDPLPIENVLRMLEELRTHGCDVVYGAAIPQNTSFTQRFRRRVKNCLATAMLHKPSGVSPSNFKIMNRFVVDEILKYGGAFPYIDGLIYRSTANIRQVALNHIERATARSEHTPHWLNMFLNFSITPLRVSAYVGVIAAALSVLALVLIWIDKIYFTKNLTPGIRTTLAVLSMFAGIQLMILGVVGEYLGRLFLDQTGTPQSVIRYVRRGTGRSVRRD